jgi:dienelactone hydrolase
MIKPALRLLAAGLAWVCVGAASAEEVDRSLPARIEVHPIPSLTVSDRDFLAHASEAEPVTVAGTLKIAQAQGRTPLVVLIHGSGGVGANVEVWSRRFNALGISTFEIDGFSGRGLMAVNTNQALLGRLVMINDAYRALDIASRHPRIDPARIVLMGFSRGGQTTLYASLKRFNESWNPSPARFKAYIPFYPDCRTTYIDDTDLAGPVRIFHGTADDYNPVAPCKAYVARLVAAGQDATLTEYADAHHSFDNPLGTLTPAVATNAQTVRNCEIREAQPGRLVNARTGEPFTYKDACVELNPHVGYHPAAAQQADAAVVAYLKGLFGM